MKLHDLMIQNSHGEKITEWYFNVLKAMLYIVGPLYLLVNSFHNQIQIYIWKLHFQD